MNGRGSILDISESILRVQILVTSPGECAGSAVISSQSPGVTQLLQNLILLLVTSTFEGCTQSCIGDIGNVHPLVVDRIVGTSFVPHREFSLELRWTEVSFLDPDRPLQTRRGHVPTMFPSVPSSIGGHFTHTRTPLSQLSCSCSACFDTGTRRLGTRRLGSLLYDWLPRRRKR